MTTYEVYKMEMDTNDIIHTILTNIIKMLTERGKLSYDKLDENIKTIIDQDSDNREYFIKMDNGKTFAVKYVPQKITTIGKTYGIIDFLNANQNNPKMIIIKEINKKAYNSAVNDFFETEVFYEEDLMINLVEHILVPKHEVLSPKERDEFYDKFNAKKRNMPKILSTDPVARYYNMKPDDICRIIRPSEKSGLVASYRLVKKAQFK